METHGITFNISNTADSYLINGDYAKNTYIGNEFDIFVWKHQKNELEFIGNFQFDDDVIFCGLSEPQLGVYLDEKVHDKGTAYSVPWYFWMWG